MTGSKAGFSARPVLTHTKEIRGLSFRASHVEERFLSVVSLDNISLMLREKVNFIFYNMDFFVENYGAIIKAHISPLFPL